ncbi:MAG: hypothetical protein SXV54_09675 [Chloroflexota bacterium]|nr:hypothetical protein [Chloroflexota bacterium]
MYKFLSTDSQEQADAPKKESIHEILSDKVLPKLQEEYGKIIGGLRIETLWSPVGREKEPEERRQIYNPREKIQGLCDRLRRYTDEPGLYYKICKQRNDIEYLVAPDLGLGFPLHGTPEERARQFLRFSFGLFGLSRRLFDQQIYVKHVLCSRMGTHCIFGLRYMGDEMAETNFVVHLDNDHRVVMVMNVYQPDESEYHRLLQVKLTAPQGDFVAWVSEDGEITRSYPVHAGAIPEQVKLGQVYDGFWSHLKGGKVDVDEAMLNRMGRKMVVLRGLEAKRGLVGRYAAVTDEISNYWPLQSSWFLYDPEPSSSTFDRVMAYYHIDLIQRYFRDLGVSVLDEYEQFNPVQVVLSPDRPTYYSPKEQRIHLQRLGRGEPEEEFEGGLGGEFEGGFDYKCTQAREARVLYHEFVHVVTDALARLRRQDKGKSERFLQAAAMDEGLADYFACSLAARHGVRRAYFGRLKLDQEAGELEWEVERTLGPSLSKAFGYNLRPTYDANLTSEENIYKWGEQWGRYLWQLRCALGVEVADMVIAHSIFFLTRWSTFEMGVLAIMLADRLLFEGVHESVILNDKVKDAVGWETCKEVMQQAAS